MRRAITCLLILISIAAIPLVAIAEQHPAAPTSRVGEDPAMLVRQLGDRSFAVRRRATARLVELGVVSIDALQQGVHSNDREISFRSQHVLQIVRENDFQRRLRAFAAGLEAAESYQLPSWGLFAKKVGTGPAERALFVEMQEAEPQLLAAIEEDPEKISEALTLRIANIQNAATLGRSTKQLSLGTIATILFVLNEQQVDLPVVLMQSIGSYFRYPNFARAIEAGSQRDVLRKMLSTWIEHSKGWDAYHAMFLAMQYDLPIGLVPAKRILEGEMGQQNQTYFVTYALLTIAKFGDTSYIPLVETQLENKAPYGGAIAVGGNKKFQTQIRDIALATLVQLAKLKHEDFGFTRYRANSSRVFSTSSVALENDEKREAAIKKWHAYRQGKAAESAS